MKVNSRITPEGYFKIVIFTILVVCALVGFTIAEYNESKDYVKVEAIIESVRKDSANAENGEANYIEFSFQYNGKMYNNQQRVVFRLNKKVGSSTNVWINPENPNEIRDIYKTNLLYIIDGFSLIFLVFMIKAYKIRKNE